MNSTLSDVFITVSERNLGALDICLKLHEYLQELAVFDFQVLLKEGITGSELWELYSRCCESDIPTLHAVLMQGTAIQKLQTQRDSKFYQK